MGRKSVIALASLVFLSSASVLLYSHFIGFERKSLANKFPEDTWAYLSIRHFNKAFLTFISDDELAASANIVKAVSFILSERNDEQKEEEPRIDPELWDELTDSIKTQVAIGVLSPPRPDSPYPEIAVVSYLYRGADDVKETLFSIAEQASTDEVSYSWTRKEIKSYPFYQLTASKQNEVPAFSWAITDDIIYLCSTPQTVQSLLIHQGEQRSETLATRISKHKADEFLPQADLSLFIDTKQSLDSLAAELNAKLEKLGSLYSSFSPDAFFKNLGLYDFDSFFFSQNISAQRKSYSSLAYNQRPKIIDAIVPGESSFLRNDEDFPIIASDSINLNIGTLLAVGRDSFLQAAPLSNFAYMGIQAKVLANTGAQLDEIIATSFSNSVSTIQTIDIGTTQTFAGDIKQILVYDVAAKIELTESSSDLRELLEAQISSLVKNTPHRAYRDGTTFHLDRFTNKTLTSGRFALHATEDYLTLGYGTLKSFKTLVSREELYSITSDNEGTGRHPQIGAGKLVLESLPSSLFEYATIFYEQMNPGRSIPDEFLEFDWTTLSVLEQERTSQIYHDPEGRIYRVSKKRR